MIDLKKLKELGLHQSGKKLWIQAEDMVLLFDQLETAQKDAARIDWLESSKESHGFCHSGHGDYRHYALQQDGYKNVREVIDEAMASKS